MTPYAALLTAGNWFLLPTIGYAEYPDGERALALIWLQLEVGVRWTPET